MNDTDHNVNPPDEPAETVTVVLGREAPRRPERRTYPDFDGYEVVRELGRGGMGVVYLARDLRLNRLVALKVLTGGVFAGDTAVARFRGEAEAVARMQHANIVQIFAVATHEDIRGTGLTCPFIALEYVDGGTLARHTDRPHPPEVAAALMETIARAVDYAHQRGIVHRDLKPANILLQKPDGDDDHVSASLLTSYLTKITDFGLAKRLDGEAPADTRTVAGTTLGTPEYMAPEQAQSENAVGRAADIYALGVMLYELLTGRVPFHGADALDTLHQVRFDEPLPPSRLQPRLPRDLDTICMRCLHKEPSRRYGSAAALANDLKAWQEGRPITARPTSATERMIKWVRRRPTIAALLALVIFTTVGGFAGVLWQYRKATARAESERLAHIDSNVARAAAETNLYFSRIIHAQAEVEANDTADAARLLETCLPKEGEADYRGWEWHYLDNVCRRRLLVFNAAPRDWVFDVAFSPDGTKLATAVGTPFLPDAESQPGSAALWDAVTGQRLHVFDNSKGMVRHVRFHPDGGQLAVTSYDGFVRVWDVASGKRVGGVWPCLTRRDDGRSNPPDAGPAWFNAAGDELLFAGPDGWRRARLADGTTTRAADYDNALDLTRDGRWLLRRASDQFVEVVDLRSHEVTGRVRTSFVDRGIISPDGRHVILTESERVEQFDVATGQVMRKFNGPRSFVVAVTFSPDGQLLAAAGSDRTVFVWSLDRTYSTAAFSGHTGEIRGLAFAPDGRRLASCDIAGQVMVWDTSRDPRYRVIESDIQAANLSGFGISADGSRVFATIIDNRLFQWDANGVKLGELRLEGLTTKLEYPRQDIMFSADGSRVAGPLAAEPNVINIWDTTDGRVLHTLRGHKHPVRGTAFSADGRRLAARSGTRGPNNIFIGEVLVWDVASGERLHKVTTAAIWAMALSPDGGRLIGADREGKVIVWDVVTGEELWRQQGHSSLDPNPRAPVIVMGAAFSPDGQTAATAGFSDGKVRLWGAATGRALTEPLAARPPLTGVTFTPDSRRVAAAGYDSEVRLWDVATGQPVLTLPPATGARRSDIAYTARPLFSLKNDQLTMLDWGGFIVVWDGKRRTE